MIAVSRREGVPAGVMTLPAAGSRRRRRCGSSCRVRLPGLPPSLPTLLQLFPLVKDLRLSEELPTFLTGTADLVGTLSLAELEALVVAKSVLDLFGRSFLEAEGE